MRGKDVNQAFRALLARAIDYAGIFPPASLPLEDAVRRYVVDLGSSDAWMLARFICPASRLDELATLIDAPLPGGRRMVVAVLATGGETAEEFHVSLEDDLAAVGRLVVDRRDVVVADQLEARLPTTVLDDPAAVRALVVVVAERFAAVAETTPLAAFEAPLAGAGRGGIEAAVAGIATANRSRPPGARWSACLKLRCGGLRAEAFPSSDELAAALIAARDGGVLVKATQGLHHPFPRTDEETGATMHGFVNLLFGAALARTSALGETELVEILNERNPAAFVLGADDGSIAWRQRRLGLEAVAAGRRDALASFGSCSFDEPRHDLRELGLLAGAVGANFRPQGERPV